LRYSATTLQPVAAASPENQPVTVMLVAERLFGFSVLMTFVSATERSEIAVAVLTTITT
jgi:hypothetical protein